MNEIHVRTEGGRRRNKKKWKHATNDKTEILTQGGSLYNITVGTVVNINIHSMMLFYLHTAGEGQEIQLE